MSDNSSHNVPSPMSISGPAAVLAMCFMAIGAASLVTSSERNVGLDELKERVQMTPPDWRVTKEEAARLVGYADARRATSIDTQEALAVRLLARMKELHRLGLLPSAGRASATFQDAHAQYTQRALDYFKHKGRDAYLALGQVVIDRYIRAIGERDKATMEALGGVFYRDAKSSRLLGDEGLMGASEEFIVRLSLMEAWLSPIAQTQVVEGWLQPTERIVLRRWKLAVQNLAAKRRMVLARELEALGSSYPVWWAMGAHAADARDWVAAAAFFERALKKDPDNRTLELNLDYAMERARRNQ